MILKMYCTITQNAVHDNMQSSQQNIKVSKKFYNNRKGLVLIQILKNNQIHQKTSKTLKKNFFIKLNCTIYKMFFIHNPNNKIILKNNKILMRQGSHRIQNKY